MDENEVDLGLKNETGVATNPFYEVWLDHLKKWLFLMNGLILLKQQVWSTKFRKTGSGVGYARGRISTLDTPKIGT